MLGARLTLIAMMEVVVRQTELVEQLIIIITMGHLLLQTE